MNRGRKNRNRRVRLAERESDARTHRLRQFFTRQRELIEQGVAAKKLLLVGGW